MMEKEKKKRPESPRSSAGSAGAILNPKGEASEGAVEAPSERQ
jgi:hypothetical protein